MVVVPTITLVTIPVLPTVAVPVFVLLHAPPEVASLSEVVAPPLHTVGVPEIAAGGTGATLTVTTTVAAILPQPLASV